MNASQPAANAKPAPPADLEIKDAQIIFNRVWKQLEQEYGRENLRFPRSQVALGNEEFPE